MTLYVEIFFETIWLYAYPRQMFYTLPKDKYLETETLPRFTLYVPLSLPKLPRNSTQNNEEGRKRKKAAKRRKTAISQFQIRMNVNMKRY